MSNPQNSIGERLSEVLDKLKRLKEISGDRDIAIELGYKSASSITEIKKDRAAPTKELLELLQDRYKVSSKYILEGIDEAFNDPRKKIIEDYDRKTIAMIINVNAKCDVMLSALAEVLSIQNGQPVKKISDQMIKRVNSLAQGMSEELI